MKPSSKSKAFAECCKMLDLATPALNLENGYKYLKKEYFMEDKRLKFKRGKQKELLELVIQEVGSQIKLADLLGVAKTTIKDWKFERNNMLKSKFKILINSMPKFMIYEKYVEKEFDLNWGRKKGGENRIAKLKDRKQYMKYIRSFLGNNEQTLKPNGMKIENQLLETLKSHNVDLLSILAVCTLTDGCLDTKNNNFRLSFSSSDRVWNNFIQALFFELSDFLPSFYGPHKGAYNTCVSDSILGKQLLKLSPDYKTYASNSEEQPTINFLNIQNIQTKIWAIRFAFAADGSISLSKQNKPALELTCYNKSLCFEWKIFLSKIGIQSKIVKNLTTKEGVSGVRICDYKNMYKFYKLGGFINKIKISRKSKRFVGKEKNWLLKKVIKLGIQKKLILL
jgi:hypothetical protein